MLTHEKHDWTIIPPVKKDLCFPWLAQNSLLCKLTNSGYFQKKDRFFVQITSEISFSPSFSVHLSLWICKSVSNTSMFFQKSLYSGHCFSVIPASQQMLFLCNPGFLINIGTELLEDVGLIQFLSSGRDKIIMHIFWSCTISSIYKWINIIHQAKPN